jgi:hypothetical protein
MQVKHRRRNRYQHPPLAMEPQGTGHPQVIQLACAASANVDLFVTNEERLQGRHVDGIQFIVPLERVPI